METPSKSASFVIASGLKWESTDDGVRRMILGFNADIMMVRVEFQRGAVGYLHSHPNRQVTYVESGLFEVEIGERKEQLVAGDSFIVDADVKHGVKALEAGCLVDVFTPAREDFLQGRK